MLRLHVTDIDNVLRCRRKSEYQKEGLRKKESAFADRMFTGTVGHYCLAEYYRSGMKLNALMQALDHMQTQGEFDYELLKQVLLRYISRYHQQEVDYDILFTEQEVVYKVPGTNVQLVGTFDLVYGKANGVWIRDHKFVSNIPEPGEYDFNFQLKAYLWLARNVLQIPKLRGLELNAVKTAVPVPPNILKNGELSQNVAQNTSVELIEALIVELNLDRNKYAGFIETIAAKGEQFFYREDIIKSRKEMEEFEAYLPYKVRYCNTKTIPKFTTENYMCKRDCEYRSLCRVESTGGNVKLMKTTEYVVVEGRE